MPLVELSSGAAVQDFLEQHNVCIVTFSAHWCGPCNASKGKLEELAKQHAATIPFGIAYEDDLGEELHLYNIRAFPTYICFVSKQEVERVQGVNFPAIQQMIAAHQANAAPSMPQAGGNALGGGQGSQPISPQQARLLRLAKLGGTTTTTTTTPTTTPTTTTTTATSKPEPMETTPVEVPTPAMATETSNASTNTPTATTTTTTTTTDTDATMTDATTPTTTTTTTTTTTKTGLDALDAQALKTLTESMGFPLLRAQKGLLYSATKDVPGTLESAIEWLMKHQEDENIDQPIPESDIPGATAEVPQSYKCNDCGKVLSNMANLELHANKTGHSDFEESTESIQPLTAEEKAAKILEIKELLKKKRSEREEAEKVDQLEREKQRRFMGKEMAKTREQMEAEQRKRDALARKKEKQDAQRERERIRAELEKDKRERQANKGKLSSKLGVDGYNPDGIQYDVDPNNATSEQQQQLQQLQQSAATKKPSTTSTPSVAKIDEYIKKVSSYRAGGDGGKALKILKAYVSNVADHPDDPKFQKINMENKVYKAKVKPFLGAKSLLLAVGFEPMENDPTHLKLQSNANVKILQETKSKLEAAIQAFG